MLDVKEAKYFERTWQYLCPTTAHREEETVDSGYILNDAEQPILERTGLESTVTAQLLSHTCMLSLLEQTLITKNNLQLIIHYNLNKPY